MAKVGDGVQYKHDASTWIAGLVLAVNASDATKLTLRVLHPSRADSQKFDVAQGTEIGQWREIPS